MSVWQMDDWPVSSTGYCVYTVLFKNYYLKVVTVPLEGMLLLLLFS